MILRRQQGFKELLRALAEEEEEESTMFAGVTAEWFPQDFSALLLTLKEGLGWGGQNSLVSAHTALLMFRLSRAEECSKIKASHLVAVLAQVRRGKPGTDRRVCETAFQCWHTPHKRECFPNFQSPCDKQVHAHRCSTTQRSWR